MASPDTAPPTVRRLRELAQSILSGVQAAEDAGVTDDDPGLPHAIQVCVDADESVWFLSEDDRLP